MNEIDLLSAGLYIFVIACSVFVGWKHPTFHRTRLLWLIFVPSLVFACLWLEGFWFWLLAGGVAWIGVDSYRSIVSGISVTVALCVSLVVLIRMFVGKADRRYTQLVAIGSIIMAICVGAARLKDFASLIDGWSPEGAATSYLERAFHAGFPHQDLPVKLKRGSQTKSYLSRPRTEEISYIAWQGDKPLMHLIVAPYERQWWETLHVEMWHVVGSEGIRGDVIDAE
jgi:hypothetical protein